MSKKHIVIAGNPNSGKTTLFNAITGSNQTIGNWPGVTVEKISGYFTLDQHDVEIVDLPGIYSLIAQSEDERIAREHILQSKPDLVINVIDASNLERNLFLTLQLLELKIPILLVLNKMDRVLRDHVNLDFSLLEDTLKAPVVSISATTDKCHETLLKAIAKNIDNPRLSLPVVTFPNEIEDVVQAWQKAADRETTYPSRWLALEILEGDLQLQKYAIEKAYFTEDEIHHSITKIQGILNEDVEVIIADYRYGYIKALCRKAMVRVKNRNKFSDSLDQIILHSFWGIPIFFLIIYGIFWLTINLGGAFIDFFDGFFSAIFVYGTSFLLNSLEAPLWLTSILAQGLGNGITTVATFVPVIFMMFLLLAVLEDSGYMARSAYIMDKFMGKIGLPGKAFVPLIVGFGCTVPAILAARTLENKNERMITIFMTPLMSCGARLPVYALFAAAFFPRQWAGLVVFALYMIGIILALATGFIFKRTLFKGTGSDFIMELPPYHKPRFKHIMIHTWVRLRSFIKRAGIFIVLAVTLLSTLSSFSFKGQWGNIPPEESVLASVGKFVQPVFEPMGVEKDNWQAGVALITGVFAKEAIIGTLNSLYMIDQGESTDDSGFVTQIADAFISIPVNIASLFVEQGGKSEDPGLLGALQRGFHYNPFSAFAYLLFVLIYFPCVGATATLFRELGTSYGLLSVFYLSFLAWIIAVLFYQLAFGFSLLWIMMALFLGAGIFAFLVLISRTNKAT